MEILGYLLVGAVVGGALGVCIMAMIGVNIINDLQALEEENRKLNDENEKLCSEKLNRIAKEIAREKDC